MSDIRPAGRDFPEPRKEGGIRPPPTWSAEEPSERTPVKRHLALVGKTLSSARSIIMPLVFGAVSLLLLGVGAATANSGPIYSALFPAALALMFLLFQPPRFICRITAVGLEFVRPRLALAYEDIQQVFAPARNTSSESFPTYIFHALDFLTIPGRLNISSSEIYHFLSSQPMSLTADRSVPPVLASYLRLQESLFGPENVWVYRARPSLGRRGTSRRTVAIGLALFLTGIVWANLRHVGWAAPGILFVVLGVLVTCLAWLIGLTHKNPRVKKWRNACLVISPGGIALVQGPLKGELKWQEVRTLVMRKKTAFSLAGGQDNGPGLVLTVEGATILVADIYHRPLEHIHNLARRFWNH